MADTALEAVDNCWTYESPKLNSVSQFLLVQAFCIGLQHCRKSEQASQHTPETLAISVRHKI